MTGKQFQDPHQIGWMYNKQTALDAMAGNGGYSEIGRAHV